MIIVPPAREMPSIRLDIDPLDPAPPYENDPLALKGYHESCAITAIWLADHAKIISLPEDNELHPYFDASSPRPENLAKEKIRTQDYQIPLATGATVIWWMVDHDLVCAGPRAALMAKKTSEPDYLSPRHVLSVTGLDCVLYANSQPVASGYPVMDYARHIMSICTKLTPTRTATDRH